ncbi:MAG: HEAT repeat domain-containing protein, partial [Desulfosarcina sp.]
MRREKPGSNGLGQYHKFREGVQHEMKRRLYAPTALLMGLLSAQLVATVHVYLSNLDLLRATEAVMRNGYLAIPNARVAERLDWLSTAMAGGLLFTLSAGAGLSLATLVGVWLWDRAFRRRRRVVLFFVLVWSAALMLINQNGWNPMASAYLVVVPLVAAGAAIRLLPARTTLVSPVSVCWPVSAALVLALSWGLVLDRNLFTTIRDHLLLESHAGRSIVEAYYAYTLFPAEAFKSLEQKQIRTCVIDGGLDRSARERIELVVRRHDYLPMPNGYPADLIIAGGIPTSHLSLENRHRPVLHRTERELIGHPGKVLADYSRALDRNRMFRSLTLVGLLLGFPLVLFVFGFSLLALLPDLFLTTAVSDRVTAALCVIAGVVLLVPVYRGHTATIAPGDLSISLSSPSTTVRVAALRKACNERLDVSADAQKNRLAESPHIVERYWLARSLACAAPSQTHAMLSNLVDDPVPIVACQARWALGQGKDRTMIPKIIDRIDDTPHWYVQM